MKLYISPGACSLSPHIVLKEAGFNFTTEKVDLKAGTYSGGDFKKINPKGYVPALELDNGEILTEGAAIVQYLADKKPDSGLMGAVGTMERARCIEWLTFISSEIHKGFSPLWNPTTPDAVKASAIDTLGKRIGFIDGALKGKDFLLGGKFSVADAYLFTVLSWAPHVKMDLKAWSNVSTYLERVAKRPKVIEAMKAEGLL